MVVMMMNGWISGQQTLKMVVYIICEYKQTHILIFKYHNVLLIGLIINGNQNGLKH